jgi:hypothetical protein
LVSFSELLSPVHSPEKKRVLEAIANRGPKIVPTQIATDTGLALPAVVMELNSIAGETNAHLEVTDTGNIAYLFPANINQAYIGNASRQMVRSAMRVLANVSVIVLRAFCAFMFFVVRISFGIALILGVVAIIVLVIAAVIALLSRGNGDNDGDGGGFNLDFDFGSIFDVGWHGGYYHRPFWLYWTFDWLWDWFFYWRYVLPMPAGNTSGEVATFDPQAGKKQKSNFLMEVFSYLFGNGDPNTGFEDSKWQTVAKVIKANQGVVVAEQLAPYLGENPGSEDWMIGILQRFNGIPEVSEKGNIVYTFPAFQSVQADDPAITGGSLLSGQGQANNQVPSASQYGQDLSNLYRSHLAKSKQNNMAERSTRMLDNYLLEENWEFMPIKDGAVITIVCFGLFVLVGSLLLMFNFSSLAVIHMALPLLYFLAGYGLLFFLIPALRYPIYKSINNGIDKRNSAKLEYAALLRNPSENMGTKLEEARQARVSGVVVGRGKVVYTTEKDALEQSDDLSDQFEKLESEKRDSNSGSQKNLKPANGTLLTNEDNNSEESFIIEMPKQKEKDQG